MLAALLAVTSNRSSICHLVRLASHRERISYLVRSATPCTEEAELEQRAQASYSYRVFRLPRERPLVLYCRELERCLRSVKLHPGDDFSLGVGAEPWVFSAQWATSIVDDARFLCLEWDPSCQIPSCRLCDRVRRRLPCVGGGTLGYARDSNGNLLVPKKCPGWCEGKGEQRFVPHRFTLAKEAQLLLEQEAKQAKVQRALLESAAIPKLLQLSRIGPLLSSEQSVAVAVPVETKRATASAAATAASTATSTAPVVDMTAAAGWVASTMFPQLVKDGAGPGSVQGVLHDLVEMRNRHLLNPFDVSVRAQEYRRRLPFDSYR